MAILDDGVGIAGLSPLNFDKMIAPANFPDGGLLRTTNGGVNWEPFYDVPLPATPSHLDSTSQFINPKTK